MFFVYITITVTKIFHLLSLILISLILVTSDCAPNNKCVK